MMRSAGSLSITALTTVRPPTPLSNIPIGLSFMMSAFDRMNDPGLYYPVERWSAQNRPAPRIDGIHH
jgi:hypothetical protein